MVPALDEAEQVLAQDLEDHADMDSVGPTVLERVEQADDMSAARMVRVGTVYAVEELDLVYGGLCVVGGRAHDFEGDVFARGGIAGQPDGREMAPAELADDDVPAVVVGLADGDGVVAALAVVLGVFFVCSVDFFL